MEIIKISLQILQAISAFLLIVMVQLHSPKGDGLGAIGSAAHVFSSQKGAEAALNKTTAYIVGTFFILSFVLGYFLNRF